MKRRNTSSLVLLALSALCFICGGILLSGVFSGRVRTVYGFIGSIIIDDVVYTGNGVYAEASGVVGTPTNITILDSVGSPSLPVTHISSSGFRNLTSLISLTIGENVTTIPDSTFQGCTSVETLTWNAVNYTASFPWSNGNFPFESFGRNCGDPSNPLGLEIIIGSSAERIPNNFMAMTSSNAPNIKTITFAQPSSLTYIGNHAFLAKLSLVGTLTIPDSVVTIGNSAFFGCGNLTGLVLGESVQTIGGAASGYGGAFEATGLSGTLVITDNVQSIGNRAFQNNRNLTSVIIGSGLTSLGNSAFSECTSVETLTWNASSYTTAFPTLAEEHPFYCFGRNQGTSNPLGLELIIGKDASFIPNYFMQFVLPAERPNVRALTFQTGGVGVSDIGEYAFYGLDLVGTVAIPATVTNIGAGAFEDTNITRFWMNGAVPPTLPSSPGLPSSLFSGDGVVVPGDTALAGYMSAVGWSTVSSKIISAVAASGMTNWSWSTFNSPSWAYGSEFCARITPDSGYTVSNIQVTGAGVLGTGHIISGNDITIYSLTEPAIITATAAPITYTITASAGSNGNISPSGSVSVNHGANQTFTFSPNTNYTVESITVDGTALTGSELTDAITNGYTFISVTAGAHTIHVTFMTANHTITASAGFGGSISPSGAVNVSNGGGQTFTFSPNTGYKVDGITVDSVPLTGSALATAIASGYTFTDVTGDHTISVTFAVITYTITASSDSNGSISPAGSISVNHGGSQTFTFTPSTTYRIANVMVDGASVGSPSSYTFSNVTANRTIHVTFAINTYTITVTKSDGGIVSPSGNVTVNHGGSRTFNFTADANFYLKDVKVDGFSVGVPPPNSYTFTDVTKNYTLEVLFMREADISDAAIKPIGKTIAIVGVIDPENRITYVWTRQVEGKEVVGLDFNQASIPFVLDSDSYVTYVCDIYIDGVHKRNFTYNFAPKPPDMTGWILILVGLGFLFLLILLLFLLFIKRDKKKKQIIIRR